MDASQINFEMERQLVACVQDSLSMYLNSNANFMCERLCAEFPNSEDNRLLLATCYFQSDQAFRAFPILQGMTSPQSRYLLAQCSMQLGKLREAEQALRPDDSKASHVVPGGAAGHYLLGRICRLSGRHKEAETHFAAALTLDPLLWCAFEELCMLGADEEAARLMGESPHQQAPILPSQQPTPQATTTPAQQPMPPPMGWRGSHEHASMNSFPGQMGSQMGSQPLWGNGSQMSSQQLPQQLPYMQLAGNPAQQQQLPYMQLAGHPSQQLAQQLQQHAGQLGGRPWGDASVGRYGGGGALQGTPYHQPAPSYPPPMPMGKGRAGPSQRSQPTPHWLQGSLDQPHATQDALGQVAGMGLPAFGTPTAESFVTPSPAAARMSMGMQAPGPPQRGLPAMAAPGWSSVSRPLPAPRIPGSIQGGQAGVTTADGSAPQLVGDMQEEAAGNHDTQQQLHPQQPSSLIGQRWKFMDDGKLRKIPSRNLFAEPSSNLRRGSRVAPAPDAGQPATPAQQQQQQQHMEPAAAAASLAASVAAAQPNCHVQPQGHSQPGLPGPQAMQASGNEGSREGARAVQALLQQLGEGFRHLSMFRCQEALQAFARLSHAHYGTGWVLTQVGKACFEIVDYNQAARAFSWARQADPTRLEGMEVYSTVLWHMKREVELGHLAQEAVALDRRSPWAWAIMGNCFSLQKEHDAAIRLFQRALQLDATFTYAYTLAGHEYFANEDFDKGMGCYRNAIRLDPRHYNAWYGVGQINFRQEKYDMAEFHFRRSLSVNGRSSVLKCYLGMALHKQGRNQDALDMLSSAIDTDHKNPLARFEKSHVLMATDQLHAALQELEILKNLAPREASVWFQMGKLYKKLNQVDEALRHFNAALDLKPSSADMNLIKSSIEKVQISADSDEEEI